MRMTWRTTRKTGSVALEHVMQQELGTGGSPVVMAILHHNIS